MAKARAFDASQAEGGTARKGEQLVDSTREAYPRIETGARIPGVFRIGLVGLRSLRGERMDQATTGGNGLANRGLAAAGGPVHLGGRRGPLPLRLSVAPCVSVVVASIVEHPVGLGAPHDRSHHLGQRPAGGARAGRLGLVHHAPIIGATPPGCRWSTIPAERAVRPAWGRTGSRH